MEVKEVYSLVDCCRKAVIDGHYDVAIDKYKAAIRGVTNSMRDNSSENEIGQKIISMLEKEKSKAQEQVEHINNAWKVLDDTLSQSPEAPPADPNVWPEPDRSRSKSVNRNRMSKPPRPAGKGKEEDKRAGVKKSVNTSMTTRRRTGYDDLTKDISNPDDSSIDKEDDKEDFVSRGYDRELVSVIEATMLRNITDITWDSVAGLHETKELFRHTVILPSLMPDFFKGLRRPWKAVCMVGPPGTGKTLLAKAVAAESKTTFFSVSCGDLASKWRGDAEKMVKLLFEMARHYAPSTIFIDEIDTIGSQRGGANEHEASRRLKAQLLVEMDGFATTDDTKRVFVLAATNFPWTLDEALRRRFEKRIYIPLPDKETRIALLSSALKDMKLHEDLSLDTAAEMMDGFSGADILNVCRQAAFVGFTRLTKGLTNEQIAEMSKNTPHMFDLPITKDHFQEALTSTNPSVSKERVKEFEDWMNQYGAV